jgi:hypothetical protein
MNDSEQVHLILSRIEVHLAQMMRLAGTVDLDAELAKARYETLSSRLDDVIAKLAAINVRLDSLLAGLDRLLAGKPKP